MSENTAITVENLSKVYRLYDSPYLRLKEALNPFGKCYHKDFYALSGVSFEIRKGETVGIIGRNGTGKSTLLKIITGVIAPSSGKVTVNGRISALLELGAGFNPLISGLENIYFNGTLIGFSKEQIDAKLDDILAFADIGDFIHQPVKTYSSGMFIRLAFAVAVHAEPEILIVDEALSVGDVMFQAKCMDRIKSMMEAGVTTLFVTHSMESINTLCNRAIMLDGGKIFTQGKPQVVTLQYYQLLREQEHAAQEAKKTPHTKEALEEKYRKIKEEIQAKDQQEDYRYGTGGARIVDFDLLNGANENSPAIRCGERFKVRLKVEFLTEVRDPCFGLIISNVAGQNLLSVHTYHDGNVAFPPQKAGDVLEVELETSMLLNPGNYLVSIGVSDVRTLGDFTSLDARKNICKVEVYGKEYHHGMIHHQPRVRILGPQAPQLRLNQLQELFCSWNAERLGISEAESRERFETSWNVLPGGHKGAAYREFGATSHEMYSVFWNDSKSEMFQACKMHEYLHLLRMIAYSKPVWAEDDVVVRELLKLPSVSIIDYGCGMAQSSMALAEQLQARGKKVRLTLVDIPSIVTEFLTWTTSKLGLDASFAGCTSETPLPEFPGCNLVIATEVFEHIHEPVEAFRALDAALAPGGFVVTDVSDHAEEFMHVTPNLAPLREEIEKLGYQELEANRIFKKMRD
ncbi:Wzt carbohydrate-binding domain-containing protein [Geomonas azotofigens]|uniref:Wzt carbohydrate-binding domain-containing protein n=1 Tax=Geomonas azotofigens TaxID=2843196 RepID=UPI001C11FB5F|nr:Wzt carbohydrate-binding domain-containing protein [Geomonas azotofigens]MBU5614577.1 Wzt carbohydrate-binding domain-containing protein [Geomonas azotofigens]